MYAESEQVGVKFNAVAKSFGDNPFVGQECVLKKCCKKYKKGKRCKKCPDH